MSVLFPMDKDWLANSWVSFGFFEDSLQHLDVTPTLRDKIKFLVEAQVDTLDLREGDAQAIREFAALVDQTLDATERTGGRDFADPTAYPFYLKKLQELQHTTREVLASL